MAQIQNLDILSSQLSAEASIDVKGDANYATSAARWSDLNTPKPGAVVNVASEADIEATVQWATANNVPFTAQSGAHGWASWYRIDDGGIVINMRKLNSVSIDLEKGEAVLGGGVTMVEALRAAKEAKAHLTVGTCNSVGTISSLIGGGTGFLMGLHSCGADNIISARLITAAGKALAVSADSHPDLFWALRGAGHNFGIVSTITIKAHPEINGGMHYAGLVAFPPTALGAVVKGLNTLAMQPDCSVSLLFLRAPPTFDPVVALSLWHAGTVESAKERFATLFDLGGHVVQEGLVPYDHLNDAIDPLCVRGGFKPTFSTSFNTLAAETLEEIWPEFVAFSSEPGAGMSTMNIEYYHTEKTRSVPAASTAVGPAIRSRKFHAFMATIYQDPSLHEKAKALGDSFRAKIAKANADEKVMVYPNFSVGDESVAALYGEDERIERLRALKKEYDPNNVFSHFIPIA